MNKKTPNERGENTDHEEALRVAIRELDRGEGVEATVGVGDNLYHFTNRVPPLRSKNLNIEVEYSSSRAEDDDLLAFLNQKTNR